jgi:hypothetical protein
MELSSDMAEHQKKVFEQMKASAELQARVNSSPEGEVEVIDMAVFTDMLSNKNI